MYRRLNCTLNCIYKNYHSKAGVYGFRPRSDRKKYIVTENAIKNRRKHFYIYQMSEAFRKHGHSVASLNPLSQIGEKIVPELDPNFYGIDTSNHVNISLDGILNLDELNEDSIENITKYLRKIYCNKIGVEFYYLEENEKEWFSSEFEKMQYQTQLSASDKKEIAHELIKSQVFDNFLATKFSSVKRYGGEGAESMMTFFVEIFKQACLDGISDIIIGIPHRGRLNLLTGLLQFPPVSMFQKMMGFPEFPNTIATCDVLSHLTSSVDYKFKGSSVHVNLLPNPSHLEAVSPVAVGYARSQMQSLKAGDYEKNSDSLFYPVLPIQVHGDASFTGQGVCMETLAMSNVPNFSVGGSIHLIINNQIGFTTPQERGRSSVYCSDLMKTISSPVIHVNGDYPEEVLKATRLAFKYRQTFQKDVLIDMLCFRRWGHNELDDPTFTNPIMYQKIHSRKSVPDMYADNLIDDGILTKEEVTSTHSNYHNFLNENLKLADTYKIKANPNINPLRENISIYDTGISANLLKFIGTKSVTLPEDFHIHPTLKKTFILEREKKMLKGFPIDWATAEALAIGSLLYQGHNVRMSGQDVGRGTFSHRHAMFVDQTSGEMYIPFNHMSENQTAFYEVANSILSEEGVLGFEYGFSIQNTNNLVIWEAQFGDFFNSAQVVFDTCISSSEKKWLLPTRLVILLPHGYDGAGPEHSSCRMERFLQMCDSHESLIDSDDINWHIVNPTTPAQYFHILRHQMLTQLPKPLIVIAPKILLRHPLAVSSLQDMQPGTYFETVLDDNVDPKGIKKLIFCTGKHYYLLQKEKETRNIKDCAIIRLEKVCPFPAENIFNILKKYKNATEFIWSQEEHRNMGAWIFIQTRFQNLLNCKLTYAGRKPLAAVAVGAGKYHQEEIIYILNDTFK